LTDAGKAEYRSRLEQTMSLSFYLMIPATFFIFFLSEPIVQLFFERGAFDLKATALTSFVVKMYVLGLSAHAICPIMSKVFHSFKNTVTPVIISAISVGLNIVLNIVFSKLLGAGGIALATSFVMALSFTLYVILVRKYINPFSKELLVEVGKTLISGISIALICYFSLLYFQNASAASLNTFVILGVKIAIVGLLSAAAFFGLRKVLRLQSYEFFRAYILGMSRKAKRSPQLYGSD
jgi:putative peptidoglycan lipid II flippase